MAEPVVYRRDAHALFWLTYHVIWCPRLRLILLEEALLEHLEASLVTTAAHYHWDLAHLVIGPDYVYVVVRTAPETPPFEIQRRLKRRSAHELRQKFPVLYKRASLWTRSYFVSTEPVLDPHVISDYVDSSFRRPSKRRALSPPPEGDGSATSVTNAADETQERSPQPDSAEDSSPTFPRHDFSPSRSEVGAEENSSQVEAQELGEGTSSVEDHQGGTCEQEKNAALLPGPSRKPTTPLSRSTDQEPSDPARRD